jgi:DDE superfamily endonuclease/Helix-turn-helix of DDE superfamily endonuclease
MSHTDRLRKAPKAFRRLTGITPFAFDELLEKLTPLYDQADARRQGRPGRKRKPGGGRKHSLVLADRLLMLLIYYRTYTTHAFLGFLFGLDDSAVGRNINPLAPMLAGLFRIPERRVEISEDEIRELFFDATERPTRRPKRGQRAFYSGKKKRHTIKTQIVVARKRKAPGSDPGPRRLRIVAVSGSVPGSVHDKKLYDESPVVAPPDVKRTGDTAYLGTGLKTPTRKPRGQELSDEQKAANRKLSIRRVAAEHGIGKMKVWRIASERYRNPVSKHTLMMKNVAGLHNLMYA